MRTPLAATALAALALFTAAPVALATDDQGSGPSPAQKAERLMRAADGLDRKAGSMRVRAGRLRSTALELRQEAQDLAAESGDPSTGDAGRQHPGDQAPPQPPTDDTATDEDAPTDPGCGWEGEDDLGFSRQGDGEGEPPADQGDDGPGDEICQLLRLADRLEVRAGVLDAAALRLSGHATKVREKAGALLADGGETSAEQLLRRAAALRVSAASLRTQADTLRDGAFEGAQIDEQAIATIRRLELRAAALEARADRLESRAAASVS